MISFRPISPNDNPAIAELIRKVFREFKIDRPGTVFTDPTTDRLYELFRTAGSCYWIAWEDNLTASPNNLTASPYLSALSNNIQLKMLGGCGIYPTPGLPEGCAELVKLYVSAEYRGKGIGLKLMEKCFESAKEMGYRQLYLETLPELSKAVGMYEKAGFRYLSCRLGNSGHFNCNIWMIKEV
ncbi:MAG TPA: GNAT family N-acetyltransferase [Bacteroidales bacterium]|nr:GNAT family N-acetyltransferase [Bacteroidales bacterium]